MSDIEIVNSISDPNNLLSKEIKNIVQTIGKISNYNRSKVSTDSTQFKSLFTCGEPRLRDLKCDIDINYAIGLLKKEDESVNVYSHLQNILDKILLEKPKNPLENFEKYSIMLKRTYIQNEVNFERVFVDNINRNYCFKSLQMYKCASKQQLEQYNINKKNIRKREVDQLEENTIMNNVKDNVQVQNLCEVNYMFNKAGFGLPMDEAALIYLTMKEMAQLNKFKSIRFWGKIFGIKQMYYVIECKWSDTELERKLLNVKSVSHYSKSTKETDNDSLTRETKLVDTENALETEYDFETAVSYLDAEMTEDSIDNFDSWISLNDSDSSTTKLRSSVKNLLPPEMLGVGANKNAYFVTNKLNTKWIELESVKPIHIVEARKIKRYFTGKLKNPINSFPKFDGSESDYLRAQIARISSSTQICPRGYYIIDENEKPLSRISDEKSTSSLISSKKKNDDPIFNENIKPYSNINLQNVSCWVHKNPEINVNGITKKLGVSKLSNSKKNEDNFEEFEEEKNMVYDNSELMSREDLFGNLLFDLSVDNPLAWKGALCSPFDPRYSHTVMKSNVWPGAFAVAYKLQTDYMYIGWGQKHESNILYTIFMDEIKLENETQESTIAVEYQEFTKSQIIEIKKQGLRKNKNKVMFPRKFNRKPYKGGEKVMTYYTYE